MANDVVINIRGEGAQQVNSTLNQVKAHIDGVGASATHAHGPVNRLGDALGTTLKVGAVAAAAGLAGLAAGLAASVGAAAGFEQRMSAVKAVSGASGEEIAQLSKLALQLGKDTSFSAGEAAKGLEELVKGGVSVADIMGGAAKASLNLAAAGEIDLAAAAEIAANAMNTFGLSGKDMAMVSDQIAGAANASSLNVNDFRLSLAAVGAVANLAGQDFASTATAIALMGAAGIKGSDAGTSLKTMLMNLQPQTEKAIGVMTKLGIMTREGGNAFFDAAGKAKGMQEIAGVLEKALSGLTEQQKLAALEVMFGSDAIRAAATLAKAGAEGYDQMAGSMAKVTAEAVAAEKLNNVKGSLEQLKGSLETVAIILGTLFLPKIKSALDGLTKFLNEGVMPFVEEHGPAIERMLSVVAETFGIMAGKIVDAAKTLVGVIKAVFAGDLPAALALLAEGFHGANVQVQEVVQGQFLPWLSAQAPVIAQQLATWAKEFVAWVIPTIPPLMRELLAMLGQVLDWLTAHAPELTERFLAEWVPAAVAWVAEAAVQLLKELPGLILTIGQWLQSEGQPKTQQLFIEMGAAIIKGVLTGLATLGNQVGDAVRTEFQAAIDSTDWGAMFRPIGEWAMEGLIDGIKRTPIVGPITSAIGDGVAAAKEALGISSPSRVFAEIGELITAGLEAGVLQGAEAVRAALRQLVAPQELEDALRTIISTEGVNAAINHMINIGKSADDAVGQVARVYQTLQEEAKKAAEAATQAWARHAQEMQPILEAAATAASRTWAATFRAQTEIENAAIMARHQELIAEIQAANAAVVAGQISAGFAASQSNRQAVNEAIEELSQQASVREAHGLDTADLRRAISFLEAQGPTAAIIALLGQLGGSPGADTIAAALGGLTGFAHGGMVPGPIGAPVPAIVHGGERITPAGQGGSTLLVQVNLNAPIYGIENLREEIRRTVRDTVLGGGFRGVLAPA